jgi:hypothetical protein
MNGLEAARALQLTMPHVPLMMFTNFVSKARGYERLQSNLMSERQTSLKSRLNWKGEYQ